MLHNGSTRLFRLLRIRMPYIKRFIQCYSGEEGAYTSTGAILPRPNGTNFGALKIAALASLGIGIGAMMSKNGAQFLEENEIFVPEDD